jgi:class 3 adenylate cyclase
MSDVEATTGDGWFARYRQRLAEPPASIAFEHRRYFASAGWGYPVAWLWHSSFIFTFWAVGAPALALLNIGSVAIWTLVLWLHFRGRLALAAYMAAFEIMAHAAICVATIGWATGFQYYVVALGALVFVTPVGPLGLRIALAGFVALVYAVLHALFSGAPPAVLLAPWVVEAMYYGNALSMFFIIFLATATYDAAATRAETSLVAEKSKSDEMAALLRRMFGRYLSAEVMDAILDDPAGLELGGEKRRVTIMLTDLRGFSALSERLAPEQVVSMLNTYFELMVEIIVKHQGTINEIIGDALLVLFGAPQAMPDRAQRAVVCAIEMQNAMREVNARNRAAGLPELEMGIGLNDTEVVVGNIGSVKRSKYAAVGSGVNLASRIESYTVGGEILASESVLQAAGESLRVDAQREVLPKGAQAPLRIYAIGGIGGAYNLALEETAPALVSLAQRVPLRYAALEGKASGREMLQGEILRLAKSTIELETVEPLAPMSDLRFNLCGVDEALAARDFYGKVVRAGAAATPAQVRFTAMPPDVAAYFEALRRYASTARQV